MQKQAILGAENIIIKIYISSTCFNEWNNQVDQGTWSGGEIIVHAELNISN